jgi:hypothetical protein
MLPLMKKAGKITCIKCEGEFNENGIKKVAKVPEQLREESAKSAPKKPRAQCKPKDELSKQSKPTEIQVDASKLRPQARSPIIQRSFKDRSPSVDEDYLENVNAIKRIYTAVMLEEVMEISNHHELSNREKLALMRSLINEARLKDLF